MMGARFERHIGGAPFAKEPAIAKASVSAWGARLAASSQRPEPCFLCNYATDRRVVSGRPKRPLAQPDGSEHMRVIETHSSDLLMWTSYPSLIFSSRSNT